MNIYKKIINGIVSIFEVIAALSLMGMLIVVLYNIIMRYFFAASPRWAEEIARQFMVIFVLIGFALGVRDKIHIALTFMVDRLFKKYTLPIEIFNRFLIFCMGIMMSAFMGPYFEKLKYNRLPGSGIPVGYIYIVPTMVGILISLIAIYQIYDYFKYGTDEQQKALAEGKNEEREKALAELKEGV